MAEIVQHKLIDPSIHVAVAADGQPREATYVTTYDDDTTEETIHMLYLEDGEVRSMPLARWRLRDTSP